MLVKEGEEHLNAYMSKQKLNYLLQRERNEKQLTIFGDHNEKIRKVTGIKVRNISLKQRERIHLRYWKKLTSFETHSQQNFSFSTRLGKQF